MLHRKKRHGACRQRFMPYPRGAPSVRGSVGPRCEAQVRGQREAEARDRAAGVEHPLRPHGDVFYADGVESRFVRCGHWWRKYGWRRYEATSKMRYVRAGRRAWRWVRAMDERCSCAWCCAGERAHDFYSSQLAVERRGLALVPRELADLAVVAAGREGATWAGCRFERQRELYVGRMTLLMVEAAAPWLEGEPLDVVAASLRYAVRRLRDPRCVGLREMLRRGRCHDAVAWVWAAARRHPGAGARVFPAAAALAAAKAAVASVEADGAAAA